MEMDMNPPTYPRLSGESGDSQLPGYSVTQPAPTGIRAHTFNTEHIYELTTGKYAWATLKVRSRAPTPQQLPTFLEGDPISGSVCLDLSEREDHIVAVKVAGKGQLMAGGIQDSVTFVEVAETLWSKDMGDPRSTSASSSSSSSRRYSGKLSGIYEWTFSLRLPNEITLPFESFPVSSSSRNSSASLGKFRLPQTFFERQVPASIQYDLHVYIERSRFRVDSKLQTMFAYIPATRPPRASALRQLAYNQNIPPPGPHDDPDGWQSFAPFTMQGTIDTRQVIVDCFLFISKPPCFTRGAPLPLTILLSSADIDTLNLFSSPDAPYVCLRRRVRGCRSVSALYPNPRPSPNHGSQTSSSIASSSVASKMAAPKAAPDCVEDVSMAVWWQSSTSTSSSSSSASWASVPHTHAQRILEGEIHLPKSLKPSAQLGHFSVEYSIVVYPSNVPGFTPVPSGHRTHRHNHSSSHTSRSQQKPLFEHPVEIATLFAHGPRPRFQAPYNVPPPGYHEPARGRNGGDNFVIPPVRGFI